MATILTSSQQTFVDITDQRKLSAVRHLRPLPYRERILSTFNLTVVR